MSPGFASTRERVDRVRARAWALQVLYLWETRGATGPARDALAETAAHRRISPRRLPYLRAVLAALDAHREEVDAHLEAALENWRLDRLAVVDRALLRLAAAEMLHLEDIPPRVSIQEAVRLAEQYGGAESPRFVNGVLDALYRGVLKGGGTP
ncbi:MAG: transcription antitermination factor NusB [Longimicrobiales bacterium]|nr:transcription antitermination factor NusB [Longimicrobiales bacterium]